jgi:hypothetical protein
MAFTFIGKTPAQQLKTPRTPVLGAVGSKLTLYSEPPEVDISIESFEQYALDRLKGAPHGGAVAGREPPVSAVALASIAGVRARA